MSKVIETGMVGKLNNDDLIRIVANDARTADGLPVLGLVTQDIKGGAFETVHSYNFEGKSVAELMASNPDYSIDLSTLVIPEPNEPKDE